MSEGAALVDVGPRERGQVRMLRGNLTSRLESGGSLPEMDDDGLSRIWLSVLGEF